jgi:phosphatidylinositol-3-phosphatase
MTSRRLAWFVLAAALGAAVSACGVTHGHEAADRIESVKTDAAKVKHVFVIVLENKNFDDTFGTSTQDPYLQKTLVPMGALLRQYYGTGHVSLDNYLSMISGQAPTQDTDNDCMPEISSAVPNFNDVNQIGTTPDGQVIAKGGCIYAQQIKTLPDQLVERGLTWKGYMEDMGNDPTRESATCGHPKIGMGTDSTHAFEAPSAAVPLGDGYATRHDPFMYFHSIIDSPTCATHVVNLNQLTADLERLTTTPNYVFITPNLCNDGHDGSGTGAKGKTCVNGEPGGLASADAFLKKWVPKILASPAYQKDGLIIITFDESNYEVNTTTDPHTGQKIVDITFPGQTCCGQQPGPNLTGVRPSRHTFVDTPQLKQSFVIDGFGGDRIGAVLLSPFVKPGAVSDTPYNHYSLLRSLEDVFQLKSHLGYAANLPEAHYILKTIGDDTAVFRVRGE